jgi:REP element-mobilizing transposase RayT
VVSEAIQTTIRIRNWHQSALNVRTNHVHVVVWAPAPVDSVMTALKANATRALRIHRMAGPKQGIWSRHGSTRFLWDDESLAAACDYVTNGQDLDRDR